MRPGIYTLGLAAVLAAGGCATYSQLMVGPDGRIERCQSSGQGLIGMTMAEGATNKCVQ